MFGDISDYAIDSDDRIIESLVRDYNLTKDKELAKEARKRKSDLKEKIKIGDSFKSSFIPMEGTNVANRVETA